MCIENSHLFFVDKYEKYGFSEEKHRVNAVVRDVESVVLELGSTTFRIFRIERSVGVGVESELEYLSPGYGEHGIRFVTVARTQTLSPIQIRNCSLLYIVRFINEEQLFCFRGYLGY